MGLEEMRATCDALLVNVFQDLTDGQGLSFEIGYIHQWGDDAETNYLRRFRTETHFPPIIVPKEAKERDALYEARVMARIYTSKANLWVGSVQKPYAVTKVEELPTLRIRAGVYPMSRL